MDVYPGKRKKPRKVSVPKKRKPSKVVDNNSSSDLEDRISNLPDEILVIILSRFSIQEAARTSVLSTRWRSLWTFTHSLYCDFAKEVLDWEMLMEKGSIGVERRSRLVNRLNQVLESHRGPTLKKLRICLDVRGIESQCDIARWVGFAMNKGVEEFNLELRSPMRRRSYLFPPLGFSNFNSLKNLSLQYANVTGKHVEHFLSNCPSLEALRLAKSAWIVNMRISGSSLKLKYLEICYCRNLKTLEISAPNLVSFQYGGRPDAEINLKNVPFLGEVSFLEAYCISFVKHGFKQFSGALSHQLQTLTLTLSYPWVSQFPKLDGLRNLNKLKLNLRVWDWNEPFQLCTYSLMKALPFLYKFSLHLFWSERGRPSLPWAPPPVEKHEHHYCLKVVELVGFVGCSLDISIAEYLVRNAVSLEKMTVHPCRRAWIDSLGELMTIEEKQEARERAHALGAILSAQTDLLVL